MVILCTFNYVAFKEGVLFMPGCCWRMDFPRERFFFSNEVFL